MNTSSYDMHFRLIDLVCIYLYFIVRRKEELLECQQKLRIHKKEVRNCNEKIILYEVDLQQTIKQLEVAKRIFLYKTSNDAMEKIYYNTPVRSNKSRRPGVLEDDGKIQTNAPKPYAQNREDIPHQTQGCFIIPL